MDVQQVWAIAAVAALIAGLAGFLIGRSRPDPQAGHAGQAEQARIQALEAEIGERKAELDRRQAELDGYRGAVDAHFDKTATLFAEMAGSYRNLFQHLSSDYEKLSSASDRERFKARISALLLDDERTVTPADVADPRAAAESEEATKDAGEADPQASTLGSSTLEPSTPQASTSQPSTPRDKTPDDATSGR